VCLLAHLPSDYSASSDYQPQPVVCAFLVLFASSPPVGS
jgi:hypothetical protein